MPVGTNATVKALHPDDIREVGASIILANTYHLYLRPGHERIARLGGLHRFMGWDGPILTDSGGFQVVSLGDLRVVDEDGVTFRSHLDGSTHRFTPERRDRRPGGARLGHRGRLRPAGLPELAAGGRRRCHGRGPTAGRSARSRRTRRDGPGPVRDRPGRPGAGPARGVSTRFIAALPFDGICIGGLAGDETPVQRGAALDVVVPLLADDPRPRYLMGLGRRRTCSRRSTGAWTCSIRSCPARVARNGQLWVPGGRLNLRNQRFLDDPDPIQDDCPCLPAGAFSRAYLAHLFRAKELLAYRLATCHNLTFTLDFMVRIRAAIWGRDLPRRAARICALRAGRMSGSEGAEQSGVKGRPVASCQRGGAPMGSRDRPHREAKKKPKAKSGQPKLSPLSEPPPHARRADPEAAQAEAGSPRTETTDEG